MFLIKIMFSISKCTLALEQLSKSFQAAPSFYPASVLLRNAFTLDEFLAAF